MRSDIAAAAETSLSVSVVMGTYNGEKYLSAQLESILDQSYKPREIIISDDGSSDRTVEIINRFKEKFEIPIILNINEKNLGFGANFLEAMKCASGDLIAFSDQDDIWSNVKLERCLPEFRDEKILLVAHSADLIDKDDKNIGVYDQSISVDKTLYPLDCEPWSVFAGFSMIFRKSLLSIISVDELPADFFIGISPLAHDRWIMFLANIAGCTREVGENLVAYRQHGSNVYGAAKFDNSLPEREKMISTSLSYIKSARAQRSAIDLIRDDIKSGFPMFDRLAVERRIDQVITRETDRYKVYVAKNKYSALKQFIKNLSGETYKSYSSNIFNYRSAVKDLMYCFAKWN